MTVLQVHGDTTRPDIESSWARSRLNGVRRDALPPFDLVTRTSESNLARAANPVLRRVAGELEGTQVALVLTDHAGQLVDIHGAARSMRHAIGDLGLVPGVQLGEDRIGTNALGTPLETRRSLLVRADEHYLTVFRGFTCYGHPIFHPVTRRLEGVLGIGSKTGADYRLSSLLARRMVRDIEERLQRDSPRAQSRLMSAFQAAVGRRGRAVVVIGEGLVLATPAAVDLLEPADHAAVRACAESVPIGSQESHELALTSGREVRLVCTPIDGADGVLVDITQESVVRRGNSLSAHVPRWPLLVVGEAGTGRTTEAHNIAGPGAVTLDATDIVLAGESVWAAQLGEALWGNGPAVVVENIQLLSPQLTALLAQRLRETTRNVVLTSTPGEHLDDIHAAVPALCNDRRELIPLRRRRHEVPGLAQQILTDVAGHTRTRFTAETMRILASQPWRGNLAELRRVVEVVAAVRSAGDIIPADLPASHRGGQAPGSPIREAEREVIMAAIEAAGGNKLQAARALGVSRSTLYNRIRALRIG
ncbi:sigma-54-dependent Fis family transcriptional regulator [Nocardia sp. NPDC057272]|uniref:sigma-54-dependent Fis family transcriptional regulator n=1 Tax=Nocardia sp. NPDC057272 TaxID=3346079 RepID=UPI003626E477